jgi:hypothetical protein
MGVRATSQRGPGLSAGRDVLPHRDALRRIGDRDHVEVTKPKDSILHYPRGKVACKRCGEPRRADALNEEGVCISIKACLKYQHQEVEPVTSTLTVDWQHDNSIPPQSNEDVAKVMREEGVSRRRAYTLLKQRRAESVDISNVSEGQRVAVLGVLINDREARKDVHSLIEECHAVGVKIDGHDVTKTLFALQHQGFVRFRERNRPRTLYAIVVTNAGHDAWLKRDQSKNLLDDNELLPTNGGAMSTVEGPLWAEARASVALDEHPEGAHTAKSTWDGLVENEIVETSIITNVGPDQQEQAHDIAHEHAANVAAAVERARALQQPIPFADARGQEERDAARENTIQRPWIKGSLGGWPTFRAIRDRYNRALKLNAAAKLLEEAGGQDEMVLTLMGETEFTTLENEVLELLKKFEEVE